MNILIVKLGAAGDVVRTTPLLHCFGHDHVTWVSSAANLDLLSDLPNLRTFSWPQRNLVKNFDYDLVINLEDDVYIARFARSIRAKQLFGAYLNCGDMIQYTEDSKPWFDISLISEHGRVHADKLKLDNRLSYQQLLFSCLGLRFEGQQYLLPPPIQTNLRGDIALAPAAGAQWPMKNWAYYNELADTLQAGGLKVNILPLRSSVLEHLSDVTNHRCLVSGDSLPMHFALGTGTRCVTLFTCTSPWEIHDYGIQTKLVSPLLKEYFYRHDFDSRATTAISINDVLNATLDTLQSSCVKST